MRDPRVELLWWEGCPSHPEALAGLRSAMAELGLDPQAVDVREVRSDAEATAQGFPGSPTIRVDGQDVQPPDPPEPPALTCRVYRSRDGGISPLPDPDDVRDTLRRAMTDA
jgi:hypothetical protein